MKKYILDGCLIALLISGCSQEEYIENQHLVSNGKIFTTAFEGNKSRVYIDENKELNWTENDQISLFEGCTLNSLYQFDGKTGEKSGTFSPVLTTSAKTAKELERNYAVYPYSSDIVISEDGKIVTILPANQSYLENSFGLNANTMVAVTEDKSDTFLEFKNVGGYLKLQLYGENVIVKAITLRGSSNEKIAGNATIMASNSGEPTISMADDATEIITLNCGENGVKIGSTIEAATVFWLVVPPTIFENGFTVSIINDNDETITKSTSNKIVINRNEIKPMEAFELKYIGWFNSNQYITYVGNDETIYPNEDDWYEYSSYINNPIGNFSKIELKYKMEDYSSTAFLCCTNQSKDNVKTIYMSQNGLTFERDEYDDDDDETDSYLDYSYTWDELNVNKTDCITLVTSFKDNYISLNDVNLEYKMIGYNDFSTPYFFTYYYSENDEGLYRRIDGGVPNGSKLYYVKLWDKNDNLVYLGAASKAVNPKTSKEEYCWRSYYNGEYHYEFAYYPTTHTNYTPYGGGIDD